MIIKKEIQPEFGICKLELVLISNDRGIGEYRPKGVPDAAETSDQVLYGHITISTAPRTSSITAAIDCHTPYGPDSILYPMLGSTNGLNGDDKR